MIKKEHSEFFGIEGIRIDNAYDPYILNEYLKYVKKNSVEYLVYQDNDLSTLDKFDNIKYLSTTFWTISFVFTVLLSWDHIAAYIS